MMMLGTGEFRDASRGEGARLRGDTERKRLSLRITQDEGRKYHRYCNHPGLGGQKMERSRHQRAEIEEPDMLRQEQQLLLEKKAIVIQRAWRTLLERKPGRREEPKDLMNHFEMVSQTDALPTNLPTGELGQNLTLDQDFAVSTELDSPSSLTGGMNKMSALMGFIRRTSLLAICLCVAFRSSAPQTPDAFSRLQETHQLLNTQLACVEMGVAIDH
ncbi:schwannomin-interacting protein 1 isoform X1 [Clarias magur]|uniref:Schwannomin-interacting protein 1 isoform X1 n=1 Tax=Clarias magur TaxID=1594786 RepID=A0A8J4X900_CLAMG|nr:schwannomin-interacting protein 1 isoform X1 [Clarias magur]